MQSEFFHIFSAAYVIPVYIYRCKSLSSSFNISSSVSAGAFKLTETHSMIRRRESPPLHCRRYTAIANFFSNTPTRCSEFARSKPSRRRHYVVQHD